MWRFSRSAPQDAKPMSGPNKHLQRLLKDWTFVGTIVVTLGLIVSISIGRLTPSLTTVGVLLAFWVITLVLAYFRLLEILQETKDGRLEVLREVKSLQLEFRNIGINRNLIAISMEEFVERERELVDGDSVLVFGNNLEVDFQPMFDVVVDNLKKGVVYKFILFEDEQIDDWEKFNKMLQKQGVSAMPEVRFERSQIATLLRSSTAIYEYNDNSKAPEGFCVLATTEGFDTCVMLSPMVARQTRDAFNKVWRVLRCEKLTKHPNALNDSQLRIKHAEVSKKPKPK